MRSSVPKRRGRAYGVTHDCITLKSQESGIAGRSFGEWRDLLVVHLANNPVAPQRSRSDQSPPRDPSVPPADPSPQLARPNQDDLGPARSVISKLEVALLVGIVLLGVFLRFGALSNIAVEHFDEGVYASNLLFPDDGFEYPERHYYAPPLVPALSEWSQLLFGSSHWVACLPGLVLGTATIPLMWWITRCWFGPAAAIAAASLIACNEFHIGLSRSILTDAPLLFFLLAAVGLGHSALVRLDFRIAALAGLVAGLAWLTKYNGWLALAIVISGAVAGWFVAWMSQRLDASPQQRRVARDVILICGLMTCVAIAVWSPVWNDLQPRGGYAAVAANHRNYVVGVSGWLPSARRHIALQSHFAGWLTFIGAVVGVISAAVLMRADRSTWNERGDSEAKSVGADSVIGVTPADRSTWNGGVSIAAIVATSAFAGAAVLSPLIVLIVWPLTDWLASIVELRRERAIVQQSSKWFAAWMCLAWLIGLLLSTPLYRPYPRLALLLMAVGWIGMGSAIMRLLSGRFVRFTSDRAQPKRRLMMVACVGVVLGVSVVRAARHGFTIWELRTELADATAQVADEIRVDATKHHAEHATSPIKDIRAVVYVYGEPAVFFHLAQPDLAVQPVSDLAFAKPDAHPAGLPTYLAFSRHAESSSNFALQFAQVKERLKLVTVAPYRPSEFVLLDDHAPGKTRDHIAAAVRVYRLDPTR